MWSDDWAMDCLNDFHFYSIDATVLNLKQGNIINNNSGNIMNYIHIYIIEVRFLAVARTNVIIKLPFIGGGDIVSPGGGGGGGSVSLPVLIDLPRVGVLLAEATVGVELLEVLLGGAGGGWDGLDRPPLLGVLCPPGLWYVSLPACPCPVP